MIEIGKGIVTGNDEDEAIKKYAYHIGLKETETQFKCIKLKPQVFSLDRTKFQRTKHGEGLQLKKSAYAVSIDGQVVATDEATAVNAISKFAALKAIGRDWRDNHNVIDLDVHCEVVASAARGLAQPYIEKQAIYKRTQFFSGGACRPR